jgi:type II secretory pathway pseudopilin PulG
MRGSVRADERGDTLVEVLVAVVVIALAVTAIVGALVAGIGASGQHRNLTIDDTLLKSYADTAKQQIEVQSSASRAPGPLFKDCADANYYNANVQFQVPASYTTSTASTSSGGSTTSASYAVGVTNVWYWDGDAVPPRFSKSADCQSDLQLIWITATAPGGSTQQLSFVVRKPGYDPLRI